MFFGVIFILYKVALTFEPVDKVLKRENFVKGTLQSRTDAAGLTKRSSVQHHFSVLYAWPLLTEDLEGNAYLDAKMVIFL